MIEIRWHARAGQGAKTASQVFAEAALATGRSAQAFPEYGPERRGAPMRAFTRVDERPIRRHDSVEHPDVVVVLEPALLHEVEVAEGLAEDGVVLVHGVATDELAGRDARFVDAPGSPNVVMLGALAALLGEPPLAEVEAAAVEHLGRKAGADAIRAALEEGYACLR